jgi:hypothetical protein
MQGYNFRGIDDVYNALAPLLSKHGLCILPRVTERVVVERETKNGGTLFYVTVKCDFDFVSAADDSKHTIVTYGEAMDSGDKATNKAMSAAYKYAAFQAFCIPVDVEDADATTHEVKGKSTKMENTKIPVPNTKALGCEDVPDYPPDATPAKVTAQQKVDIRARMVAAGIIDRAEQTALYKYALPNDDTERAAGFISQFDSVLEVYRKAVA